MSSMDWLLTSGKHPYDAIVKEADLEGPLKWNEMSRSPVYTVTFKTHLCITNYKIQTNIGKRFMKGWNIIGYNGSSHIIATESEDFCKKTQYNSGNGCIDCGENTIREFPLTKGCYTKITINMTTNDSCNSYQMSLCGLDLYGFVSNSNFFYRTSCKQSKMTFKHFIYLFILYKQ